MLCLASEAVDWICAISPSALIPLRFASCSRNLLQGPLKLVLLMSHRPVLAPSLLSPNRSVDPTGPLPTYARVDDSVIQRILRHSNLATTQNHYIKTASPDAVAAMKQFSEALLCPTCAPESEVPENGRVQ
jgi:hypothetical protein